MQQVAYPQLAVSPEPQQAAKRLLAVRLPPVAKRRRVENPAPVAAGGIPAETPRQGARRRRVANLLLEVRSKMNRLKIIVLLFAVLLAPAGACTRCPQNATNCPASGGTAATGGNRATGGAIPVRATGGTKATDPGVPPCVPSGMKVGPEKSYPLGRVMTAGHSMLTAAPVQFTPDLTSVRWDTVDLVNLTQRIGSCTGNAAVKAVGTAPFDRSANETDAETVYSAATKIDPFKGQWPPTDTGSDGNSALQALKNLGWSVRNGKPLSSWVRATSFEHAITLLHSGPIIIGIPWRQSNFSYDSCGKMLDGTDPNIGAHELAVVQWIAPEQNVVVVHSWGPEYGIKDDRGATGYGRISRAVLTQKLLAGGDAIGLVPP